MTLSEFTKNWTDFSAMVTATLARQDSTLDKREGSVLYDFASITDNNVSSFALEIADLFDQMFLTSSTGTYLDQHAARSNVVRHEASACTRKAYFYSTDDPDTIVYPTIPLESSWSGKLSDGSSVSWIYKARVDDTVDYEVFECQVTGSLANDEEITLSSTTYATYDVVLQLVPLIYGEDDEDDDALILRTQTVEKTPAFGGNRTDYKEKVEEIDGVYGVQIYPAWQGGGTVLLSLCSPEESDPTVSTYLVDSVKELVDPLDAEGEGVGYAPIGHSVTVQSVGTETIKFAITNVAIARSYQPTNVTAAIKTALAEAFTEKIHTVWSTYDSVSFDYVSQLTLSELEYIIMGVAGVRNVAGTITTFIDGVSSGTNGYSIGVDARGAFKKPVFDSENTTISYL